MEDLTKTDTPEDSGDGLVDEAMLEMSEFVSEMTDVDGYLLNIEMNTAMQLEKLDMSMPIQLDLHVRDDGSILLGGSPPLYYTPTTFSPVFHQLTVNIEVEKKETEEKDGGNE